jgi:hypothetical protein
MRSYWRSIDWKVLFYGVLACYVAPTLVFGTLMLSMGENSLLVSIFLGGYVLLPPLAAGYFTARYSSALPQLHVAAVALLGLAVVLVTSNGYWPLRIAYAVLSVALCALGAFIYLRRGGQSEA